jgi:hypothetical protein
VTGVKHTLPPADDAAALGKALVAVDAAMLRQVPGKHRRWWKGVEPCLAINLDDVIGDLVFVEVCIRGRFARRHKDGPLETGHTDELELSPMGMPTSRMEQIDNERRDVVVVARAVLEGAGLILESAFLAG